MRLNMRTSRDMADRLIAKHPDISPSERRVIEKLGDVCLTGTRLMADMEKGSPQYAAKGAQHLYRLHTALRECIGYERHPDGPLFGFCVQCEMAKLPLTECKHHDIHETTLLAMAMLRLYPEYDMDVRAELDANGDVEEDIDPNSGMVEVEEK